MKHLSKVVWSEGMYLGPHHFQAQARYFEDIVRFGLSSLWFEPCGLVGFELDAEALRNGTLSLVHGRGIFPDGLVFDMPESDPPPAPRNIAEAFPPTQEKLTVLLAIPPRKPEGMNCALSESEDQDGMRYVAETVSLHDENTGRDDKPVRLGRKRIRFLLDTENASEFLTLPLARVMRDGSGHVVFDEHFIPPCVQIGASNSLMMMTRRLIDILEEKSATIASASQTRDKFQAGFSAQEVSRFWFLHAINASLSPLRHLYLSKRGHPEELFSEFARLAGALCTFGLDSHPAALPLYDHQHLENCFEQLDQHIRTHLELMVPTNVISIPLRPARKYFYEGEVTDARCLGRSRWIFGIQSRVGDADLISRTLQLVKICSAQFVPELVKRALPGLALAHMPVPPSAVSRKVESQYFGISKAGPCWDHIVQTKRVGVYVPGELPQPETELLVILES